MSKIIDITDKLNFEEKPKFKVKDVVIEANNDAVTMLKVVSLLADETQSAGDILTMYNLLFDEVNREKIASLNLSLEDFSTFILETASILVNDNKEPDEGETQTPVMI